jgi:hypothetical protein
MLSYLTVRFPLSFWRTNKAALRGWWFDAVTAIRPEQAYAGLSLGLPPILERYPFMESAEFALARHFYGLDIDKPFFMLSSQKDSGMHLEQGMRTPTFGVLVRGKYLEQVGGEEALRAALGSDDRITLTPCAEGLWIQAGEEPALYPIDEGIPRHVAKVARALKPARLKTLWLISYLPPLPREDCFTPPTSRRWLARFDEDGDWPGPDRRQAPPDSGAGAPAEAGAPARLRCEAGQPCPREGYWFTPASVHSRRHFKAGEVMPDMNSAWGDSIWQWDENQG